jgi:hypothetical protein
MWSSKFIEEMDRLMDQADAANQSAYHENVKSTQRWFNPVDVRTANLRNKLHEGIVQFTAKRVVAYKEDLESHHEKVLERFQDLLDKERTANEKSVKQANVNHAKQCKLKLERLCLQHGFEMSRLKVFFELFFTKEHSIDSLNYFTGQLADMIESGDQ